MQQPERRRESRIYCEMNPSRVYIREERRNRDADGQGLLWANKEEEEEDISRASMQSRDQTVDQGVSETWSVTRRIPVFSAYIAMDINNCWYLQ